MVAAGAVVAPGTVVRSGEIWGGECRAAGVTCGNASRGTLLKIRGCGQLKRMSACYACKRASSGALLQQCPLWTRFCAISVSAGICMRFDSHKQFCSACRRAEHQNFRESPPPLPRRVYGILPYPAAFPSSALHTNLAAGNPAVFLRKLKPEEAGFLAESAEHYAKLAAEHGAETGKSLEQLAAEKGLAA